MKLRAWMAAGIAAAALTAHAEETKKLTPQQERMAACNKAAADKKGDERKAFMAQCLSGKVSLAQQPATPQERMKQCNADAGDRKGEDRKAFMKQCLSAKA